MSGEAISEFFDATLEVRRFEKNYFLYGQLSDYEENIRYVTRAGELFDANIAAFAAVETEDRIIGLRDNLQLYKDLMGRYENLIRRQKYQRTEVDSALKIKLAGDLRRTGKDIITVSEEMSKTERRNLQLLLASSRRILIISISVLIVMVIAIGQIMARMVVKPLKLMEVSMEVIADGRFENIRIDSRDREVVSSPMPSTKCSGSLSCASATWCTRRSSRPSAPCSPGWPMS